MPDFACRIGLMSFDDRVMRSKQRPDLLLLLLFRLPRGRGTCAARPAGVPPHWQGTFRNCCITLIALRRGRAFIKSG